MRPGATLAFNPIATFAPPQSPDRRDSGRSGLLGSHAAVARSPPITCSTIETLAALIADGKAYVILLPVYVLLLVGERIAHGFLSDNPWNNRDAATNIVLTGFFLLVDVVLGAVLPVALFALIHEYLGLFTLGTSGWAWLAAFVLYDLAWYIDHRIGHRTGFFWAMHQIHHSSNEYNMPVASRGFVFDNTLLSRPTFYFLAIFGFSATHLLVVKIISNVWGIAQHTRLVPKLGVLDWLFATPSSHRVHHGSDDKYLDRNYGEVLMIWDHLFGSYQVEEEEPIYGLTEPLRSYNLVRIQTDGFSWLLAKIRRSESKADKLRCLYKPPGWEPSEAARC